LVGFFIGTAIDGSKVGLLVNGTVVKRREAEGLLVGFLDGATEDRRGGFLVGFLDGATEDRREGLLVGFLDGANVDRREVEGLLVGFLDSAVVGLMLGF
jgi:hypothetical protein